MPTISPQGRANIGGNPSDAPAYRPSVSVATGLNIHKASAPQPENLGQEVIKEETPTVTLSPQLTALARKQQKLQAEIQAHREKEAAWEAKQSNYVSKEEFKAKAQQNAVEALKDLGYTYDEITNLLLTQSQGKDPVQEIRAEIDQLKKSQEESVNKQYEATLKQYRAEADSLVDANPKAYHLIKRGNHQDAIVEHIVETWKEDETKVLTIEQAAKEIEDFLRVDAKAKADALKELEEPKEETQSATKTLPPPKTGMKTLTRQAEVAPTRSYGQFQHLSPKERLAQAMARAQR